MNYIAACPGPASFLRRGLAFLLAFLLLASPSSIAGIVQGFVSPAGSEVKFKREGEETPLTTLNAGPFKRQLPPGRYIAECRSGKTIGFIVGSRPTTVNIDCS